MIVLNYLRTKIAPYILAVGLFASLVSGCKETRKELSDLLHEDARVMSMEHHSSWIQLMPMQVGEVTTMMTIVHPERNEIKFEGKVNFELNNKQIYGRFNKDDSADVSYREEYELTFEDLDKDGVKEQTGKVLMDYKFVDALPKR